MDEYRQEQLTVVGKGVLENNGGDESMFVYTAAYVLNIHIQYNVYIILLGMYTVVAYCYTSA